MVVETVICGLLSFGFFGISFALGLHFTKYQKKKALYHGYIYSDLNGDTLRFTDSPVTISDLSPGDHIYVRIGGGNSKYAVSNSSSGLAYHHGVYLGRINKEDKVADFGRENHTHPVITSLNEFMYGFKNIPLYIRRYTSGFTFPVENILEIVDEMEGSIEWGEYELLNNNCEHFATYLKTGKPWSFQAFKGF